MFSEYITILEILKKFHELGIYGKVTRGMTELSEGDVCELVELGMDNAAPIAQRSEVPMGGDDEPVTGEEDEDAECDHYHQVFHFSSPAMKEYYRLCRLYEYREKIEPEDNPFVKEADDHYCARLRATDGQFLAGFDSDYHTTELQIETCPEWYYNSVEIIIMIHDTLAFYTENLEQLARELRRGPLVFLPALPAWKGEEHEEKNL
ncbi:MAG: hypothetical protein LBT12_05170 [Oscillospiraceae bacterium]|jgi:hypothetical protein|nr:hypothetical protein [Oscillospiraceae bacterium]